MQFPIPSQLFNPDIKKKFIRGHVHLKDLKTSGGVGDFFNENLALLVLVFTEFLIFSMLCPHIKISSSFQKKNAFFSKIGRLPRIRPLVQSAYQKTNFLVSQPKHMLLVLKRTV